MRTPLSSIPASSGGSIPQDNIIFAFIFLAFFIFITIKGELPKYMGFFVPGNASGPNPVPSTTQPGQIFPGLSSNPFQGLPLSWPQFFQFPGFNFGSPIFEPGGQANPNTGPNTGYGGQ